MNELELLQERVSALEEENRNLRASATIPYDIEQALRVRLIDKTKVEYRTTNVSNPPTEAELTSAFGNSPVQLGSGFIGLVDDAGAETSVWLCLTSGTTWWYESLTKAT